MRHAFGATLRRVCLVAVLALCTNAPVAFADCAQDAAFAKRLAAIVGFQEPRAHPLIGRVLDLRASPVEDGACPGMP